MEEEDYSLDLPYLKLPIDCAIQGIPKNQSLSPKKKPPKKSFPPLFPKSSRLKTQPHLPPKLRDKYEN